MSVTIEQGEGDFRVMRTPGLLKKSELDEVLANEARQWKPTTRVRVLVIVQDFKGWERGADWGDVAFFSSMIIRSKRLRSCRIQSGKSRP